MRESIRERERDIEREIDRERDLLLKLTEKNSPFLAGLHFLLRGV